MSFLRNQAAWLVLGLLLSGVWWLMTHTGGVAPAPAPTTSALTLGTPATLILTSGETVHGTITGAQALCPSWQEQLAAGGVTITLPDGRTVHDPDVRTISAAPADLGGLAALVTTTACGDTLTLHAATAP